MSLNRLAPQGGWSSRWTFVAAAAGLTIGLGTFWRFGHEAGENGGGAFVLMYIGFMLLIAVPILLAEVVLGSRGRASPITAMQHLVQESLAPAWWRGFPVLASLASLLILAYLSVIGGWVLAYVPLMFNETLTAASVELTADHFTALVTSAETMLNWQGLFIAAAALLAALGMTRALGRILRIVVPIILIMLAGAVYCGYRLGNFGAAWAWLFEMRLADVSGWSVLTALGLAFFTVGVGMGAMMVFGAYFPDGRSLARQVLAVVLLDIVVAVVGGLAIYALVLDQNIVPGGGVALLFVSLPFAFGNILFGDLAGALFFAMLGLVVLTSAVAMLEPAVAWLEERRRWPRLGAVLLVSAGVWLAGVGCIYALTEWSGTRLAGYSVLEWLDAVAANVLLPVCALGFTLFAGWRMRPEVLRDELHNSGSLFFSLWRGVVRYIAPAAITVVLVAGLYQRFGM